MHFFIRKYYKQIKPMIGQKMLVLKLENLLNKNILKYFVCVPRNIDILMQSEKDFEVH